MDFRVGRLSASQVEKTPRLPFNQLLFKSGGSLGEKDGVGGGIYFIYTKM